MKARKLFFDSPAVISAVDRATRRVLSKFGAYVRTAARSSIRSRKGISRPGQPPHSHEGLLRRLIFFGYDLDEQSVVIGPIAHGKGEAPELLEYGGTTIRQVRLHRPAPRRRRRMVYRARPFMGPAFEKEQAKLPAMWAGSVR